MHHNAKTVERDLSCLDVVLVFQNVQQHVEDEKTETKQYPHHFNSFVRLLWRLIEKTGCQIERERRKYNVFMN